MFGERRLPAQPNPLIGREDDLARVRALLLSEGVRLVSLTGPGGVGKTRLAIEGAASLAERFPDGVYFVDLAPLQDAALVPSAIVRALGIEESGARPPLDALTAVLRDRSLLLVLDTFEHLLPAAAEIAALLTDCPQLRVLATSRVPLRLRWEHELAVPPLALPIRGDHRATTLAGNPAVALLLERARAVRAGFALTDENASAVAGIVDRLEGLPLAIELAAARLRSLSPDLLLTMLDDRLGVLTGGPLDAPDRQKSVRDSIAWSYQLLSPELQTLLRRLSVFAVGCTLEGATAVTSNLDAAPTGARRRSRLTESRACATPTCSA